MPGCPFIYYGDEIGMRYVEGLTSVEGGYNRTGARSPMQWNSSVNAGFSQAKPEDLYIPMDTSADRPTAESQMADPDSIYHEVRKLIATRQANPILQSEATIEFVYCEENAYPLAYRRVAQDSSLLCVVNPSGKEASFPYSGQLGDVLYRNGGNVTVGNGIPVSYTHLTLPTMAVV